MARLPVTHANCPRCGGRLARDNDSGRCAPCQAAERDRLSAPPMVPASFWEHEPVRQALAERHLGRVIRAYRCHPYHGRAALPQTVVAGWLGITQAQFSRVENGPPLVHLDRLAHWAQLLGIPGSPPWFTLPWAAITDMTDAPCTEPPGPGAGRGTAGLLAASPPSLREPGLLGGSGPRPASANRHCGYRSAERRAGALPVGGS